MVELSTNTGASPFLLSQLLKFNLYLLISLICFAESKSFKSFLRLDFLSSHSSKRESGFSTAISCRYSLNGIPKVFLFGLSMAINFTGSLINSSLFFEMILFSSKYLSPAISLILLHDFTDIMKRNRIVNFERLGWAIKEYKTKLHFLDVKQK